MSSEASDTLFLGNLSFNATEEAIQAFFAPVAEVNNIRIIRGNDQQPRGFGYAHFNSVAEAQKAIEQLNGQDLEGRAIRLDFATGTPRAKQEKAPSDTCYIGNMSFDVTEDDLRAAFSECGAITNIRVIVDSNGRSKGFAYITYESIECATKAVEKSGLELKGRAIRCDFAQPRVPRREEEAPKSEPSCTLYLGNLAYTITEEHVRDAFSKFGNIKNVHLITDRTTGQSKGFGYVEFDTVEQAQEALSMNGQQMEERALRIDFAQEKPAERPAFQRRGPRRDYQPRREQRAPQNNEPSDTLFVGNLPFSATEDDLKSLFPNCKNVRLIMDRESGNPKGFGYVTFNSIEEAQAAMGQELSLGDRQLRCDFAAQQKERAPRAPRRQEGESTDRRARRF